MDQELQPNQEVAQPAKTLAVAGVRRPRIPSTHILPSERFPFQVHLQLIRRFVQMSGGSAPIAPAKVDEAPDIPAQAAVLNARFLADIKLLRREETGYIPTPEAVRISSCLSISEDRARPLLGELLRQSWFAEAARTVLQQPGPHTVDQLILELAFVAETDLAKKKPAMQVLVDYLVFGQILSKDGGNVSIHGGGQTPDQEPPAIVPPVHPSNSEVPAVTPAPAGGARPTSPGATTPWLAMTTDDFALKIRPDLTALADLRDHLGILEKKIQRQAQGSAPKNGAEGGNPP